MPDPGQLQKTSTQPPRGPDGNATEIHVPTTLPPEVTTLPPDLPLAAPDKGDGISIPGYEILSTLGRGGMGVVYRARHHKLDRIVALKMILAGGHAGRHELDRFQIEAEAVARLQHPGIVQIHEVGEHGGLPYFSLEFVPGGSLASELNGDPWPAARATEMVEQVARAMQHAHEHGIIHRDLKPANVLLAADGTPKVTDFGLAKKLDDPSGATQTGAVMGTPSYVAPEQASGRIKDVGPATDVYALGAVLYELLTGRPPFKGASVLDTLAQVLANEPVPPSRLAGNLPADVETICLKCLQKEPARRYASAGALADDLRRYREGRSIVARPVGRWEQAAKWLRRNPAMAGAGATVSLALLLGTAVSAYFGIDASREAAKARSNEAEAIAKGNELATANETLSRTASDLRGSRDDLKRTADDLRGSRDTLEVTLARSLLRPLAVQVGFSADQIPMTDVEWDALRELANNRGGRVGYRFVEEASRTPGTSRQLRDRAALALPAAVGLDKQRRSEVENLLLARLADPELRADQRRDLALALSAWDGLSGPGAILVARQLIGILTESNDVIASARLVQGLSSLAGRLESREAVQDVATLTLAMTNPRNGIAGPFELSFLGQGVSSLAGRLEPREAARVASAAAAALTRAMKDPENALYLGTLAEGLASLVPRLESREAGDVAAQLATALTRAMQDTKNAVELQSLVVVLTSVAARLDSREAARAAAVLVQAIKDVKNADVVPQLAESLSAVVARMEAREAALAISQTAAALTQAINNVEITVALPPLVQGLSAVAARMEPREAALAYGALTQAMQKPLDAVTMQQLAQHLSGMAARLDRKEASQAAASLVQAMKQPPNLHSPALADALSAVVAHLEPRDVVPVAAALTQAMLDPENAIALSSLAQGVSAVAPYLGPQEAAKAVAALTQAIKESKNRIDFLPPRAQGPPVLGGQVLGGRGPSPSRAVSLPALAQALSAVAARLESRDADRMLAQTAAALTQAIQEIKDEDSRLPLMLGLSSLAAHLDPKEVSQVAVALTRALKDATDSNGVLSATQGLSALATYLEPRDAAQAAATVIQAMKDSTDPSTRGSLARALSAMLSTVPPAELPIRSGAAASAVAFAVGPGRTLAALLLISGSESLPCRLSTQHLVEFLKMPTCIGEAQRIVLDHLGNRYKRRFADAWEFVRFASEQRLDLDFTTPPQRPEQATVR